MRTNFATAFGLTLVLVLAALPSVGQEPAGWIITTDYSTFGRIRSFEGEDPWAVSADLGVIPGDAVGRHHDGLVYIVGRGASNLLQVWNPAAGFVLVDETSLGSGLNPQDIAFDGQGDAYVSCYDAAVLLRVDPADGTVLGTYDTSIFADADGLPETSRMATVGDRLYITCQLLDRNNWYGPTGPGALLVFDMVAEAWVDMDPATAGVQPILLQGANPYTRILVDNDRLMVGCAGFFGLADGGIETVDPAAGASTGILHTEVALGGDINRIQLDGDDLLVVVNDAAFNTSVVRAGAGGVQVLDARTGFVHADILLLGDYLYVADRTVGDAGLRVLDPVTGDELSAGTIPTGLPPLLFVLSEDAPVSGVDFTPAAVTLSLGAPFPNPCNPSVMISLAAKPGALVRIDVVDLRGRRVRTDHVVADASGSARYHCDGRDANGRSLAAGIYHVLARSGGAQAVTRFTLVK